MSPPHFLKGGEEVVLGVDNLGTQKHKVFPYKE
jgi:2-keto-4-pentenoate hydratase/2-oxohepta-3-ene-1,7-dioic acid hydratase in catechol pathway